MKYTIKPSTRFQKDLKLIQRRGYEINLLTDIIKKLANGETLPIKNRDHLLSGEYLGLRECHILPDLLLIYEVSHLDDTLYLARTGTHSDLFK